MDGNGIGFCDDGLEGPRLSWTGGHKTREMGQHLVVVGVETVFGVEEDVHTTKSREAFRKKTGAEKGTDCFLDVRYSSSMCPHSGLPLRP